MKWVRLGVLIAVAVTFIGLYIFSFQNAVESESNQEENGQVLEQKIYRNIAELLRKKDLTEQDIIKKEIIGGREYVFAYKENHLYVFKLKTNGEKVKLLSQMDTDEPFYYASYVTTIMDFEKIVHTEEGRLNLFNEIPAKTLMKNSLSDQLVVMIFTNPLALKLELDGSKPIVSFEYEYKDRPYYILCFDGVDLAKKHELALNKTEEKVESDESRE